MNLLPLEFRRKQWTIFDCWWSETRSSDLWLDAWVHLCTLPHHRHHNHHTRFVCDLLYFTFGELDHSSSKSVSNESSNLVTTVVIMAMMAMSVMVTFWWRHRSNLGADDGGTCTLHIVSPRFCSCLVAQSVIVLHQQKWMPSPHHTPIYHFKK